MTMSMCPFLQMVPEIDWSVNVRQLFSFYTRLLILINIEITYYQHMTVVGSERVTKFRENNSNRLRLSF